MGLPTRPLSAWTAALLPGAASAIAVAQGLVEQVTRQQVAGQPERHEEAQPRPAVVLRGQLEAKRQAVQAPRPLRLAVSEQAAVS